jgi:outer membrane protein assembly factor BamB
VLSVAAKDGKVIWKRDFALTPFARHEFNSFASSTPAVDAERVYVAWNEPEHFMLSALDHDGKTIWQRDFGPFVSQHGCGISPIVYKDKVILGNEQDDMKFVKEQTRSGQIVVAVDAKMERRSCKRRRSAVVAIHHASIADERQSGADLCSQGEGIYALEPDTGNSLAATRHSPCAAWVPR